ncbi:UNVERIFIED_CONTAM: hypothetical protein FKN15_055687 [Acipenser sinensis]
MHQVLGEPQDADPRGRALCQARLYLEQIRSRVSTSRQDVKPAMAKRDYLVDAAKQIRMALDREISEDYEAAFNYYKNGVDLLLKGVQVDPNKERREAVKRKTTQYLKRAEEIFNSHLQGSLGSADSKSRVLGEPQDADPRGRALCQARLYLEQIRSRVSTSRQDVKPAMAKRDYLVDAAKQIRIALDREISEDYEAAFNYYKNGVDLLLKGVQVDPNKERREAVKRKTTQYLKRAEEIFNSHLQGSLGSADSKSRCQGFSSLRFRPIRILSSPVEDLKMYKVTGVIDKVLMVQNPTTKEIFVVKVGVKSTASPLANEVPQATETSVQSSSSETACESQLVCENVTLKLEEDFSDPHVQTWMEGGRGALATEGTSKVSSTARRPAAVAGQYLAVQDEEGRENLSNTAANQQERTEGTSDSAGALENSAPIRVDSSNVDSASIMIGASSGNGQCLMKLPVHNLNAANQVSTDQDPIIPSVKDLQVTSTKVKGQEEEEDWELLSPLNRESGAFPMSRQVEVLLCDSRGAGAGSKASQLRKNGYCSSSLSPASDLHIEVDGWCLLPNFPSRQTAERPKPGLRVLSEDQARLWVAQILLALESLHEQGIVCRDLNPKNLLLDSCGQVRLTYFGQWGEVQSQTSPKAMEDMYCAPEVGGVCEVTEACDWWSLGALLYELLTGMSLKQCHPSGILPHTQLHLPDYLSTAAASLLTELLQFDAGYRLGSGGGGADYLSTAAASLLTELLQFDAGYRLGSGGGGVSDIKGHPFFSTVPWQKLSG